MPNSNPTREPLLAGASRHEANPFDFNRGPFRIQGQTLRGGLSDGVELVTIDNGRLQFDVLPTRGMGLWQARLGDWTVGWRSPVRGPVHPQFVPLGEPSGLGWLDGFDELLVRCGLESNGAPEFDERGRLRYPLHGRIANRPAQQVGLSWDEANETLTLSGEVDETRFLQHGLRLHSAISTRAGEPSFTVIDEIENLTAREATAQMLYHINFGPPLLEAGAKVVAAVKEMAPRDDRAAEDAAAWSNYAAPTSGYAEQVYFFKLLASDEGKTEVLLQNRAGNRGVSLAYNVRELPCFTLWKNTAAEADGYVTGLEPGTNYPNPRSFETERGRVLQLQPGERARMELTLTMHDNEASVLQAQERIAALQGRGQRKIHHEPRAGWCLLPKP